MIKNRDQIDQAGRAFYWRRNPNESPMIAESTRPDIVIGFREGYEEALRDIKAALEPQESLSSPFKDHRYWSRLKEKGSTQDPAICEYSGLRPVEGYKEEEVSKEFDKPLIVDLDTEEGEKLAEAYRRGYADGYHEGVYDGQYK